MGACHPQSNGRGALLRRRGGGRAGGWSGRSSLAVLPLMHLGSGTDESGVGLGFADTLVTRLGNLAGIDVLPTSAVLNMPLEAAPLQTASRLGVRFLVHGAIQMS